MINNPTVEVLTDYQTFQRSLNKYTFTHEISNSAISELNDNFQVNSHNYILDIFKQEIQSLIDNKSIETLIDESKYYSKYDLNQNLYGVKSWKKPFYSFFGYIPEVYIGKECLHDVIFKLYPYFMCESSPYNSPALLVSLENIKSFLENQYVEYHPDKGMAILTDVMNIQVYFIKNFPKDLIIMAPNVDKKNENLRFYTTNPTYEKIPVAFRNSTKYYVDFKMAVELKDKRGYFKFNVSHDKPSLRKYLWKNFKEILNFSN